MALRVLGKVLVVGKGVESVNPSDFSCDSDLWRTVLLPLLPADSQQKATEVRWYGEVRVSIFQV